MFVEPPAAAAQETKYWRIPVVWEMYGTIAVEAETPEEALKIFRKTESEGFGYELPEGDYVDGSFDVADTDEENLLETIKIISE